MIPLALRSALVLLAALPVGVAQAQPRAGQPAALPGQVQPIAPGTRPAPTLPILTLTPAVPGVHVVNVLGNGFITVAHAILTLSPAQQPHARAMAATVAARVLAARPDVAEVDVSAYDADSYAGFGGPLPLLTASVPRARAAAFEAWAAGRGPYDRQWVNPGPQALPTYRAPDRVRETGPTLTPSGIAPTRPAQQNRTRVQVTGAQISGGDVGGLLYRARRGTAGVAALTFDDAPHPLFEPLLLDLLRRSGARATFFVIGRNAQAYPYFVRDMVAQGHEVANHTYHHVRLPPLTIPEATDELRWTDDLLKTLTGKPVRYFRPPGGDYTAGTLDAARRLGLTTVFWTDDPGDFQNPGDATLETRYRRRLRAGGIVLLHDNAPEMLDVLRDFLRYARQQAVTLTTVGGLPK
ncbi:MULTISPECIES: polysaccharide deacetylase family protein [Deinococcus]|uniref:Polysaccharide deacetylase family protein n=1 Tax=Deinococcus rufus TaxID=2136097 RepID=A0ABV7ZE51_9DEIO|nr:polysaccharide deacetylase family protein [Deinococcus sp. AB2017081]WQE96717.1 polysaccharide deacetylase family protein [Deinococcus sp. AB2017081]